MTSNQNLSKARSSQSRDSVYLYNCENKDLYNEVLENLNKSDCIFNRNLMAYIEDRNRSDDSFYSKHILSCSSCREKAKEYKKIQNKITHSIPNQQMSDELLSTIKLDIKAAQELFNQDTNAIERINLLTTFKKSMIEFLKGSFISREIIFGFFLASICVLIIFLIN